MKVLASNFASLADVRAYNRAKAKGMTDQQAFAVGDNGIGCWGDLTAQEHTPMCALPPDDMQDKFGDWKKAKHQKIRVQVVATKKVAICVLADRMPWKKNIKNGCGIDLNPAAMTALGLKNNAQVDWSWV